AEQPGVLGVVQGADVNRRNHQDVRGRLGIEVLECEHPVALLHDLRRDLAGRDLTEDAAGCHSSPPRRRLERGASSSKPSARRTVSQNFPPPPSSCGASSSISRSCSSTLRCSALSLLGVQTCTRTCRSPWPPSPRRGRPLARSR